MKISKAIINLSIMGLFTGLIILAFFLGRWTAPVPRVEMIWTPLAEAVTIGLPAEGPGIALFRRGDLVKVWQPTDGHVYEFLNRIYNNPLYPEKWETNIPAQSVSSEGKPK